MTETVRKPAVFNGTSLYNTDKMLSGMLDLTASTLYIADLPSKTLYLWDVKEHCCAKIPGGGDITKLFFSTAAGHARRPTKPLPRLSRGCSKAESVTA